MLYSIGKDSSVMLRLAQKAFSPARFRSLYCILTPAIRFPEMISFVTRTYAANWRGTSLSTRIRLALDAGTNPFSLGTQKCCGLLKTKSLLDALAEGGFNAAFGGARRDERRNRGPKRRIYSFRDPMGHVGSEKPAARALEHF